MHEFVIKQGDTAPILEAQLLDGDGNPINLQGAQVTLCMGRYVRAEVEITNAAEGRVRHVWRPGDTDREGTWDAEFVIRWISGVIQRAPGDGFARIRVAGSLCGSEKA